MTKHYCDHCTLREQVEHLPRSNGVEPDTEGAWVSLVDVLALFPVESPMTTHLCDHCGEELFAQWWTRFEMDLCRRCYDAAMAGQWRPK